MKRFLIALMVGLTMTVTAQEQEVNANVEKINELTAKGNECYQNKDYEGSYEAWSEALQLMEKEGQEDKALVYNTGYSAFKAKKYKDAIPYFEKSIENGYKESKPYQLMAVTQYKSGQTDAMIETCNKGLEKYPNDAKLKDLASKAYLKKGLAYYNKGNSIKKKANQSGWNESDPERFEAEYARADEEFKKALPFMEKSYEVNPKNSKALKALENIYRNLDMTDKADEAKAKLESM